MGWKFEKKNSYTNIILFYISPVNLNIIGEVVPETSWLP